LEATTVNKFATIGEAVRQILIAKGNKFINNWKCVCETYSSCWK